MKRYCLYTALSLSVILNVAVVATAGYKFVLSGDNNTGGMYLSEELNLNTSQQLEWKKISAKFRVKLDHYWKQAQFHRTNMIQEVFADTPSYKVIENERSAILKLQDEMQLHAIKHMQEEKLVLTGLQQKKLAELLIEYTSRAGSQVPYIKNVQ